MQKNKHLKAWILCGYGRTITLAKQIGASRQYVSMVSNNKSCISNSKFDTLIEAMRIIEEREAKRDKSVCNNIAKARKTTFNIDQEIADFAKLELKKWTMK